MTRRDKRRGTVFGPALRSASPAGIVYSGMIAQPVVAEPIGPVFLERVLLPHRSLPPRGFNLLMLLLGIVSFGVSVGFLTLGAWPVCGFFGLDVALVYVAFRVNYRSARRSETIRLADDFTVERIGVRGDRRVWRFQPFWLRVTLEERPDESNRLCITSHGRSLIIADFLSPTARRELASTIADALRRWRAALNPAAASE
jgi:uncharacterized membrane protein